MHTITFNPTTVSIRGGDPTLKRYVTMSTGVQGVMRDIATIQVTGMLFVRSSSQCIEEHQKQTE